jgi:hypothetical protein
MGKREIKQKFNEIVPFAEVEKLVDTPVKHYSSGMYVGVAFAVAAHWSRRFSSSMSANHRRQKFSRSWPVLVSI